MEMPKTIQDLAKLIFQEFKDRHYTSRPSCATVHNLYQLANGSKEDCLLFNNAGGMPFDLWVGDVVQGTVEHYNQDAPHFVYAYRLDGEEVINRYLSMDKGYLHWLPEKYWIEAKEKE